MRAFAEPLRRVLILGMYTGQRRGDPVAVKWSAYANGTIRVAQERDDVALTIPVHKLLRSELERWRRERPVIGNASILTTLTGKPWTGDWLSTAMAVVVRSCGLPEGLNIHGLRKLAGANLAEGGRTAANRTENHL